MVVSSSAANPPRFFVPSCRGLGLFGRKISGMDAGGTCNFVSS
jgi:hypothetical protein